MALQDRVLDGMDEGDAQQRDAGCRAAAMHDQEMPTIGLFDPLTIRGVTFPNRVAMSPMCQYSASEGMASDWHFVHLGSRAVGGAGLIMAEASAVTAQGRITPGDLGIWNDEQIEPLARIVSFIKSQGKIAGIQLAHAGRKASCHVPWQGGMPLQPGEGAWTVVGPSPLPFSDGSPTPQPLDEAGIASIVDSFAAAARRAMQAGFQVIEIHSAHGYLLHSFLSPLSNQRTDQYGGSLDNRMRLTIQVATHLRKEVVPATMPLFLRISASDWVEGGWDIEQSIALARELKQVGVDLIDASSGGIVPYAQIVVKPGYQVPFASRIRQEAKIATGAVGLITDAAQAEEIVTRGCADLVFVGRQLLREPYWAVHAQCSLDDTADWPIAYGYAVKRRGKK